MKFLTTYIPHYINLIGLFIKRYYIQITILLTTILAICTFAILQNNPLALEIKLEPVHEQNSKLLFNLGKIYFDSGVGYNYMKVRVLISLIIFFLTFIILNLFNIGKIIKSINKFPNNGEFHTKIISIIKYGNLVSLCIAGIAALIIFFTFKFYSSQLIINIQSEKSGKTQIFYDIGRGYNELDSYQLNLIKNPSYKPYIFFLPPGVESIRFDPINSSGSFQINSITLKNPLSNYTWKEKALASDWKPLNQIVLKNNKTFIQGQSLGVDPQFILNQIPSINLIPLKIRITITMISFIAIFLLSRLLIILYQKKLLIHFLCLTNIVVSLGIIAFPPESLIYTKTFVAMLILFFIPGWLTIYKAKIINSSFLVNAVLSIAIGCAIWIIPLYFLSITNIIINRNILNILAFIPLIIICFLILIKFKSVKLIIFKKKFNNSSLFYLTCLNLLLFLYIMTIKGLIVPPLHDPSQNSYFSNELLKGNFIWSAFPKYAADYPPGFAYLIALVSNLTNIETAKITLILTNIFNLMVNFSFAAFVFIYFRKKYLDILAFFTIAFLSTYPEGMYYSAGKNSQIVAYFFFFSSLIIFYIAIKQNKLIPRILSTLIFGVSFLVHFNNIIITLFFVSSIYLSDLFTQFYQNKIQKIFKDIIRWAPMILILLFLLIIQLKIMYSTPHGKAIANSLDSTRFLQFYYMPIQEFYRIIAPRDFFSSIRLGTIAYIVLVGTILYKGLFKKKILEYEIFLLNVPFIYYITYFLNISIISHLIFLNIFIIFILLNCYFLYSILKKKNQILISILIISLILIKGIINYRLLYDNYNVARNFSTVKDADLKAFNWINKNISKNYYFLPANITSTQGLKDFDLGDQVLELDAILYLKVYTNNEEIFGFASGNKFDNEIPLRKKYVELSKGITNVKILKEFTKKNIDYIYDGSYKPWGYGIIDSNQFSNYPKYYKKIYDVDNVKIYKIVSDT